MKQTTVSTALPVAVSTYANTGSFVKGKREAQTATVQQFCFAAIKCGKCLSLFVWYTFSIKFSITAQLAFATSIENQCAQKDSKDQDTCSLDLYVVTVVFVTNTLRVSEPPAGHPTWPPGTTRVPSHTIWKKKPFELVLVFLFFLFLNPIFVLHPPHCKAPPPACCLCRIFWMSVEKKQDRKWSLCLYFRVECQSRDTYWCIVLIKKTKQKTLS